MPTSYFVLIKRKNASKYLGAIPARKGISISSLRSSARKQIKPGFSYKIITETQLKRVLPSLVKRKAAVKKRVRRNIKRKSVRKLRR